MLHRIDVFDLLTKKPVNHIQMEREGPNGIANLDVFTISSDSIIIQNEAYFLIMNHRGEILKKLSKDKLNNSIDQKDYSLLPTTITLCNFEDIIYDKNHQELIIPVSIPSSNSMDGKYCIVVIDIKKEEANLLPVIFPENVTNKYYGKLGVAQILVKGDSIIYNFANSSNIYVYDRMIQQVNEYDVKSEYTHNLSANIDKSADMKEVFDHYLHSLFFHNVQYDHYRNLYYRIHTDNSEDKSAFNGKETYLTIINSKFEKVDEIQLPENTYPIYNITKKGLLFVPMKGLHEDSFTYFILHTPEIYEVKDIEIKYPDVKQSIATKEKIVSKTIDKKEVTPKKAKPPVMTIEKIGDFIRKNTIYPEHELENKIEGRVFVVLKSDSLGKVVSYEISEIATDTDNENFRKEALRIGHLIEYVYPNIIFSFHVPFLVNRYLETKKKQSK